MEYICSKNLTVAGLPLLLSLIAVNIYTLLHYSAHSAAEYYYGQSIRLPTKLSFSAPPGADLRYSLHGLPIGTGISIDADNGQIHGKPSV